MRGTMNDPPVSLTPGLPAGAVDAPSSIPELGFWRKREHTVAAIPQHSNDFMRRKLAMADCGQLPEMDGHDLCICTRARLSYWTR